MTTKPISDSNDIRPTDDDTQFPESDTSVPPSIESRKGDNKTKNALPTFTTTKSIGYGNRSISSPHINLKEKKNEIDSFCSSQRLIKRQKQTHDEHTYHEIYIDLQNSIMLEHETGQITHSRKSGLNEFKNRLTTDQCNEEFVTEQGRIEPRSAKMAENKILDSYVQLKAWTNATDTSVITSLVRCHIVI